MVGRCLAILVTISWPAWAGVAYSARPQRTGETYAVTLDREMSEASSDGSSSGSSTDVDTLVERVTNVSDAGVEMTISLPDDATAQERAATWQLPARVLVREGSTPQLLDAAVLAARVDPWLKKAGWTRAQCGKSIFTWNAFTIDCDPQSVVRMVERFTLDNPRPSEGAAYAIPGGTGVATIRRQPGDGGSTVLVGEAPLDTDKVRRQRAETDVQVAALSGKTLTSDAAASAHAGEAINGTVRVTFAVDAAGRVVRRTTVTRVESRKPGGPLNTQTVTETLSRRCVANCS